MNSHHLAIAKAIRDMTREDGFAPTVRELCTRLDKASPATMQKHLENMRFQGWLEPCPPGRNATRTLRLTEAATDEMLAT